jgi:hypothetical protein
LVVMAKELDHQRTATMDKVAVAKLEEIRKDLEPRLRGTSLGIREMQTSDKVKALLGMSPEDRQRELNKTEQYLVSGDSRPRFRKVASKFGILPSA